MSKYDRELFRIQADLCKAFADANRQMIIAELRTGEKTVGDLEQILEISQSSTSRHLAILHDAGIVKSRRDGTNVYYALSTPKIADTCDMMHEILLGQLKKNRELANRVIP